MRWRFCESEAERATRDRVVGHIDAWWAAFRERASTLVDDLQDSDSEAIAAWVDAHLKAIHPKLAWELGPAVRGAGYRLVITPESEHWLGTLVAEIVARAPVLDGWEFYDARLSVPAEEALLLVKARAELDVSGWRAAAERIDSRIELHFVSPEREQAKSAQAWDAAWVAAECLLGERCMNQWIADVDVVPERVPRLFGLGSRVSETAAAAVPLDDLAAVVDSLIRTLRDELPSKPRFALSDASNASGGGRELVGYIYELEPAEADDYPALSDVFLGNITTPDVALVEAVRRGLFDSSSHSQCEETFCYLKLERVDPEDTDLSPRNELMDALDAALLDQRLGCAIGAAVGLRYFYIDLALVDLERAVETVREVIRRAEVPERTWLLFHDSALAAEWLGAYPHSPPPPGAGLPPTSH